MGKRSVFLRYISDETSLVSYYCSKCKERHEEGDPEFSDHICYIFDGIKDPEKVKFN